MRGKARRRKGAGRLILLLGLVAAFLGYVPSEARGPLQRERAVGGIRMYYAPQNNLAEIDYAMLGSAKFRIDLAAYVLTDRGIMQRLLEAAGRGVKVRLYLDPDQPAAKSSRPWPEWEALLSTRGIEVRSKNGGRDLMHLKAYQVDGRILRTGAANFSYSGMRRQDNDLLVIESVQLAAQFISRFNEIWTRPGSEQWPVEPR